MATRSRIGIRNENGTITSVYCHHDGYVEGVGSMLVVHYQDADKIRRLMELGDMSSLGTEPVSNENAWETPGPKELLSGKWNEVYKKLHPENMCDTYATRGEECPARTHDDLKAFLAYSEDCWCEYSYLFEDGKWSVFEYGSEKPKSVQTVLDNPENDEEEEL